MPTSAANDQTDTSSSTSEKNAKLIGGLVGSIGGTIVIGLLVALFLFLKKRKKVTNQSPDFNDNTSGDSDSYKDKSGFKKLFSSKNTNTYGGVAGVTDIERQNNTPVIQADDESNEESDDFVYRGVTNNNNLDSIFRSTASNSSGQNTATGGSANQSANHTRMNSIGHALDIPYETRESEEHDPFASHTRINSDGTDNFSPSDYDIDQNDLVPADRSNIFGEESHSNNSRSRFHEEII